MDRRNAIKTLTVLMASSVIPIGAMGGTNSNKIINYIGVGTAGSTIISKMIEKGVKGNFTYIDNKEMPKMGGSINYIFHPKTNKLEIDKNFIIPTEVKKVFNSGEKYVLIAGLGHYSGTNLILAISKLLNDIKIDFSTVCSIPFRFEGKKLTTVAKEAVSVLTKTTTCKYYHLDDVRFKYGGDISVVDALSKGNDEMANLCV